MLAVVTTLTILMRMAEVAGISAAAHVAVVVIEA